MNSVDNETNYPNKPFIEKKNDISKSIINILLFLLVSYFYFNKNVYLIVVVFIILIIHELGHLFAMRSFNYKDLKVFFIPLLGAYASGVKKEISQKQSVIIFLCGPLPGILLGIGLYYYSIRFQSNLLYKTSYYFFLINLFNLLPIKPLDGGNILSLIMDSNKYLKKAFIVFSIVAIIGIVIYLKSYVLLVIPIFMVINQFKQIKIEKIKENLNRQSFNLNQSFDDLSNEDYWKIRTEVINNFRTFQEIKPDTLQISKRENIIVEYVKLITQEKVYIKDLSSHFKKMTILIFVISLIIPSYFLKRVLVVDVNKNKETFYELLSTEEIESMKEQCISSSGASMGLELSDNNKVFICNCYVDEIIQSFSKPEFDQLFKLDKKTRVDSLRHILTKCINNDSINIESILKE